MRRASAGAVATAAAFALACAVYLAPAGCEPLVFACHSVGDVPANPQAPQYTMPPGELRSMIAGLMSGGYTFYFADEYDLARHDDRSAILTFDDGYEDNYTELPAALAEFPGAKATVFVTTELVGRKGYMTVSELRKLAENPAVSVQSHTKSHPDLRSLTDAELASELRDSRDALTSITGRPVTAVAYPFGLADRRVADFARLFYRYGYVTEQRDDPPMRIARINK